MSIPGRSLLSYDDISSAPPPPFHGSHPISRGPPPPGDTDSHALKRKRNWNGRNGHQPRHPHWDSIRSNDAAMPYGSEGNEDPGASRRGQNQNQNQNREYTSKPKRKKARQLTQEELWDDSALIEAWDASMEEYRVFYSLWLASVCSSMLNLMSF